MINPTSYTRTKTVRIRDASGNLQSPDAAADPTLVVYKDGVAIAPTVTWTQISAGIWRYSYETPATACNIDEYFSATVDAAAGVFDGGPHREYFTASFDVPGPFAGTGAHAVTVTVTDTEDNPLEGATVRLLEGVNGYAQTTDASGQATFGLDPATYSVFISKAGFSFTPATHQVTADTATHTPTFEMSQVVITPSADPELTTAYLTIRDSQGAVVPDQEVIFQLFDPADQDGAGWRRNRVTATSDANGLVQVELVRSSQYQLSIGGRSTNPGTFTTGAESTHAIEEQLGFLERT